MAKSDFVLSLATRPDGDRSVSGPPRWGKGRGCRSRTALPRAAVRRLLVTLELQGYASHRVGESLGQSSSTARIRLPLLSFCRRWAQPILQEVSSVILESSSLSILEGFEIVYLAGSATKRVMSVGLSVGSRLPAWCTSMGGVLITAPPDPNLIVYMATSPRSRLPPDHHRQGVRCLDQELEVGHRSIAAPVITRTGRVMAAMNTGVHAPCVSIDDVTERFLPALKEGAISPAAALG